MLPNILQCTGLLLNKDHMIPNANSARLRTPELERVRFHLAGKATTVPLRRVSLGVGAAKTPSRIPASEGSGGKSEGESRRLAQGHCALAACVWRCLPTRGIRAGHWAARRTQTGGGLLCVRARTPL